MVWRVLSWASIAASTACLVLAMVLNPDPHLRVKDIPWIVGFFVFLVAAPILWVRGQRRSEGDDQR